MSNRTASRRLTPKRRVLRKYPAAFSYRWRECTSVLRPLSGGNVNLGTGTTPAKAWAEAWETIRSGKDV